MRVEIKEMMFLMKINEITKRIKRTERVRMTEFITVSQRN